MIYSKLEDALVKAGMSWKRVRAIMSLVDNKETYANTYALLTSWYQETDEKKKKALMSEIDDELLDVAFYSLEHGTLPPHYARLRKDEQ